MAPVSDRTTNCRISLSIIATLILVISYSLALTAGAKPPKWVEQVVLVDGVAKKVEDAATPPAISPEQRKKILEFINAQWKKAEEGPASKYLKLIEDRAIALEWLKSPLLEEPANPVLVDPLDAAALDRDPVYYVNGPWRTRSEATAEASELARFMHQPVWLIYNPTTRDDEQINREDYLRLLAHLLFFGIPVPENLVEATLDGGQLVDVDGLEKQSLADAAESQWDTRWFDWMSQAPELEIAGLKKTVYPHQHNETTRQLASILIHADRPLTVVTHSQGGLIFRNASLIASKLSKDDWSKRKVTWRSLAFPLAEKPNKAWLPGMIQVQLMFAPEDPLAMLLSGRGPYVVWQNSSTQTDAWGFAGVSGQTFNPLFIQADTLPTVFVNFAPPPLVYQYGKQVQFLNDSNEKIRVYWQYMSFNNGVYSWQPQDNKYLKWPFKQLQPGESWNPGVVTPVMRYWVDYERGYHSRTSTLVNHWLVPQANPFYVSNSPETYLVLIPNPGGGFAAEEQMLVVAKNNSKETVSAQIKGLSTLEGDQFTQTSTLIDIAPNEQITFKDSEDWPVRVGSQIHAIKMQSKSGAISYTFPPPPPPLIMDLSIGPFGYLAAYAMESFTIEFN